MGINKEVKGRFDDEELRFLATHYKIDLTATEIAAALCRSRNSIIGMANRCGMGLPNDAWADGADPVTNPVRRAA